MTKKSGKSGKNYYYKCKNAGCKLSWRWTRSNKWKIWHNDNADGSLCEYQWITHDAYKVMKK